MIYVTVGTMWTDFGRLLNKMDAIAAKTDEEVIVQRGMASSIPHNCTHFEFKPREEVLALQRQARVIVSHGGVSVLDALLARRPLIMVPRLKKYGEHMNDHQMDICTTIANRNWGRMILDVEELEDACANPPPVPESYTPGTKRLVSAVRDTLERFAALRT